MNRLKILVTGCGGDIGQSIGKILLESFKEAELYGIDISDKNAAKFIFPNFQKAPKVTEEGYIDFIKNFVRNNAIDVVIPIAEPELREYSLHGWDFDTIGAKVITANHNALAVGFDKMATVNFLEKNGFTYPVTRVVSNNCDYPVLPVVFKSRTGSGSKSVVVAEDIKSFEFFKEKYETEDFIIQEFIPAEEGEFTCGLFRSRGGEIRSIVFRRELTGGYSGYGEIVESDAITSLLKNIAISLDLRGSINVQLRLKDGNPYIFEINPRFSSTVYFRHLFGFEDVVWSLADLLEQHIPLYKINSKVRQFYKGFSEYID